MDLLVNDFVWRAVHDRAVVVFEGHCKRNYIHIRDVVRTFLHAIDHFEEMKNRPYNVGLDDANLSKLELCREIQRVLPQFVSFEAPIGEDPDKRDSLSRINDCCTPGSSRNGRWSGRSRADQVLPVVKAGNTPM